MNALGRRRLGLAILIGGIVLDLAIGLTWLALNGWDRGNFMFVGWILCLVGPPFTIIGALIYQSAKDQP